MTKITFRVPDMHCSACVMTLEGLEDELDGVARVSASYHRQQMEVEFDERLVTPGDIIAAAYELGYTLVPTV